MRSLERSSKVGTVHIGEPVPGIELTAMDTGRLDRTSNWLQDLDSNTA